MRRLVAVLVFVAAGAPLRASADEQPSVELREELDQLNRIGNETLPEYDQARADAERSASNAGVNTRMRATLTALVRRYEKVAVKLRAEGAHAEGFRAEKQADLWRDRLRAFDEAVNAGAAKDKRANDRIPIAEKDRAKHEEARPVRTMDWVLRVSLYVAVLAIVGWIVWSWGRRLWRFLVWFSEGMGITPFFRWLWGGVLWVLRGMGII